MHVDRQARDRAAQLFRNFIAGRITNDEFEGGCPDTEDRAIHAIWQTAWVFYDDFSTHTLVGKHRLSVDERRVFLRWIMFLHSDLAYEWPDIRLPGIDPAVRVKHGFWRRLLSLPDGLTEIEAKDFLSSGHYKVWPFISVRDYKRALSFPRLLSGKSMLA